MRYIPVFLCLALLAGCQAGGHERVLGDYGTQPELQITRLQPGDRQDLRPIIESARKSVASSSADVWPEPARMVEHERYWDVWFAHRDKVVDRGGTTVVRTQAPSMLNVVVQKSDLTAQLGPGR